MRKSQPKTSRSYLELLRQFPKNAAQRYSGLTLQQAIVEAKDEATLKRLSGKTLENYFNNIVTILNFAVEKRLISHNPASGSLAA